MHSNPGYVDVGVQTNAISTWDTVKQWFLDVFSIRSSELSSMGHNQVDKWRTGLDPIQSVDLKDSESPLTILRFGTDSSLQNLVVPDDSASQISEVVSEADKIYDITDPVVLNLLMADETIDFNVIDNIHYAVSDNMSVSIDPSIINLFI